MWAVILMREGILAEVPNCILWNTDFLNITCIGYAATMEVIL